MLIGILQQITTKNNGTIAALNLSLSNYLLSKEIYYANWEIKVIREGICKNYFKCLFTGANNKSSANALSKLYVLHK